VTQAVIPAASFGLTLAYLPTYLGMRPDLVLINYTWHTHTVSDHRDPAVISAAPLW